VDGHSSREVDLTNFDSGICSESFIKPLKWSRYLSAVLTIIAILISAFICTLSSDNLDDAYLFIKCIHCTCKGNKFCAMTHFKEMFKMKESREHDA
jgi:hypothetical protein